MRYPGSGRALVQPLAGLSGGGPEFPPVRRHHLRCDPQITHLDEVVLGDRLAGLLYHLGYAVDLNYSEQLRGYRQHGLDSHPISPLPDEVVVE